jgi:ELP3 family radical SAM enzyme/protein acetyltransferase
MQRKYRVYLKKNIIVYTYRKMIAEEKLENKQQMWQFIQKSPARNMSGVTIITVLTSPYPDGQSFSCKHNCYYCPNEPDQPRSYLKSEPAVARANRNQFDPILQMNDRLRSLHINGHELDKLEIVIEGGTMTEYPKPYLERFHRDLIYCANTYFDPEPKRDPFSVEEEVALNASAKVHIIGICVETRPDALFDDDGNSWLPLFRKWGVTRIQLGVQHTNNMILKKINRGHTFEDACKAVKYLKNNGYKVDIHLMPDLPNATPELDIEMFDIIYNSPDMQPDQIKVYPCEVVPWTVIQQWHESGKYKPYAQTNERALLDVVKYAMEKCPTWIRLPRVIRDIPLHYIQGGNMYPNLRQMLMDELEKEGKTTMDIRARECGRNTQYNIEDAEYNTYSYKSCGGIDYFIALESRDCKCLFGFTRLRIPYIKKSTTLKNIISQSHKQNSNVTLNENEYEYEEFLNNDKYTIQEFKCLENLGLIRELHVYGNVVPVGLQKDKDSQHKGVGRTLLEIAEKIARDKHYMNGVAVISGIGVMNYYKALGYKYKDTYMIKKFTFYKEAMVMLLGFFIGMTMFILFVKYLFMV